MHTRGFVTAWEESKASRQRWLQAKRDGYEDTFIMWERSEEQRKLNTCVGCREDFEHRWTNTCAHVGHTASYAAYAIYLSIVDAWKTMHGHYTME